MSPETCPFPPFPLFLTMQCEPPRYLEWVTVQHGMCSLVDICFRNIPHSCVCLSLHFHDFPLCIYNSMKEHSRTIQIQFARPLNTRRFKDFILKSSSKDPLNFFQRSTFICVLLCIVVFVWMLSFYHLASIAKVFPSEIFYFSFA